MTAASADALFVRAHTRLGRPGLVPELQLQLGWGVVELWEGVEVEAGRTGLEPPFWAFPWSGGQALARHVLDHPDLVAGRSVLDLATGSGLVAVAAARAGAAGVTANDIDPYSLAAALANATANRVTVDPVAGDLLDGTADGHDVVLAGDVCYSREMTARVLPFLRQAAARGATVLLGDPGRAYLPAGLHRCATYDVPVTEELESTTVRRTTVWQV